MNAGRPDYVYVASSWRNSVQPGVVSALRAHGIDCYDFKNPAPGDSGFSWKQVTPANTEVTVICEHCGRPVVYSTFANLGAWEPDYDPARDPECWRHVNGGYAACGYGGKFAVPKKGSDLVPVGAYLEMLAHPVAIDGYGKDFAAMERADAFVLVLPCGRSAHLELGWAVGAGKRTAILLEDPAEPELMYRMVDYLAPTVEDLMAWLDPGSAQ